ncbi:hypothetical protein [Desulfovibrio sp. Fe33]|uniref:hypothetical protein n=1 Tax=Desulfovibrio sp. Fe33 TaxID=3020842 RepID=UPI00234DC55F|nr:hypothetical protein [Desulfovibrio sp. Fe33]
MDVICGCKGVVDQMDLRWASSLTLPDVLEVRGKLDVSGTDLVALPDGLAAGYIDARYCENLSRIGSVKAGKLNLRGCVNLTGLPSGLKVAGDLDLSMTRIDRLPDDLEVDGDLFLLWMPGLTAIPDGVIVRGTVYLDRAHALTRIPNHIRVVITR